LISQSATSGGQQSPATSRIPPNGSGVGQPQPRNLGRGGNAAGAPPRRGRRGRRPPARRSAGPRNAASHPARRRVWPSLQRAGGLPPRAQPRAPVPGLPTHPRARGGQRTRARAGHARVQNARSEHDAKKRAQAHHRGSYGAAAARNLSDFRGRVLGDLLALQPPFTDTFGAEGDAAWCAAAVLHGSSADAPSPLRPPLQLPLPPPSPPQQHVGGPHPPEHTC
jgi:hypothetical protein